MTELKCTFQSLLADNQAIILDGGLATELEAQGHQLTTALWSAQLLLNNPVAIKKAHLAYLDAGAQIITTASYQASIDGFMTMGLSADQANKLILDTVMLAEMAVADYSKNNPQIRSTLIAASIGPYGAYLADGSEYRGNYQVGTDQLIDFHQPRLALLDNSGVDVLGCETIPSYQEAKLLADLLNDVNTPAWVSFSCIDGQHLNDGTRIEDAVGLFVNHPNVHAIGINCTPPTYISELIRRIKNVCHGKAIIVYPNSGELYDEKSKSWASLSKPETISRFAELWHQQGAQIIGGCCRIGPDQIKAINAELTVKNKITP